MVDDELRQSRAVAKATEEFLAAAIKCIDEEIKSRGAELFGLRIQKRQGSKSLASLEGLLIYLCEEFSEIFSNTDARGVSNVFRLLEETEPSVPFTRLFPALHRILESYPENVPDRFQSLNAKQLKIFRRQLNRAREV
jgi:hypothetical protein